MMIIREYFKILSSIAISLLVIAILAAPALGLFALIFDKSDIFSYFVFPFVIAWFGFVLFGIIRSALWVLFLKIPKLRKCSDMRRQGISAFISMLFILSVASVILGVTYLHRGLHYFLMPYIFIVPISPVILASLLVYNRLFVTREA